MFEIQFLVLLFEAVS